jgi:hypothetical protein
MIHEWILPSDLCPDINVVNVYGYSYDYVLRLAPGRTTCLFFDTFSATHHIALSSANTNSTFRVEFFTHDSLAQRTFARGYTTTGSAGFSSEHSFFVRLANDGKMIKNLYVGLATLRMPVLYTECRAEELDALDELPPDGSRPHAAEVSAGVCVNPIDAIALFWGYLFVIVGITLAVVAVLNCRGWLAWGALCGCRPGARREAMVAENAVDIALVGSDGGEIDDPL